MKITPAALSGRAFAFEKVSLTIVFSDSAEAWGSVLPFAIMSARLLCTERLDDEAARLGILRFRAALCLKISAFCRVWGSGHN